MKSLLAKNICLIISKGHPEISLETCREISDEIVEYILSVPIQELIRLIMNKNEST